MPRNSRANIRTESSRGIGHNVPQEAPQAFAKAIVDVEGY
jgi:pimeloyl-ACP methyl ester carboxylesterase